MLFHSEAEFMGASAYEDGSDTSEGSSGNLAGAAAAMPPLGVTQVYILTRGMDFFYTGHYIALKPLKKGTHCKVTA